MTTARRLHYTYEDYRRALAISEVRLEYLDGEIYAMAGGTPAHGALAVAMAAVLRQRLLGRCTVYSSDVNIHVEATGLGTFPDGSVVCGETQTLAIDKDAVVNPVLLVEVTSKSTEDYDRGEKLSHYKQLSSLKTVVFVSHRSLRVTVVQRAASGGWNEREFRAGETVLIDEPPLQFAVDEIYQGIVLEP